MQRAATLLKRSDASLYRVFFGAQDCAAFAQRLAHEHCFTICAVLHAPGIAPDAQERLEAAILALGTHRGNSWFEASLEQAVNVFLSVLPAEAAVASPCVSVDAEVSDALVQENLDAEVSDEPAQEDSDCMETDDPENPIWEYVRACSAREASKAVDIRAALEGKVGKKQARTMLACARPTVAKDATGKKNRVFKLGGSLLMLK
jgi:hypothetical protein